MKKKNILILCSVLVLVLGVFFYKHSSKNVEKTTDVVNTKTEKTKNISQSDDSFYANKDIQFKDLLEKKKPIILDFSQEHCHACKVLHKYLEKLYDKYKDEITIKSVDLRKSENFANEYPIRVTPTLFFFKSDGTPFEPSKEILEKINHVSYKKKNEEKIALFGNEGVIEEKILEDLIKEMIKNGK